LAAVCALKSKLNELKELSWLFWGFDIWISDAAQLDLTMRRDSGNISV
jgi:hypothetical protein